MDRGMRKAVEKLDAIEGDDIGALLKAVGMALVSSVGGAAGPLYGTLFLQMGTASRRQARSSTSPAGPMRSRPASRACRPAARRSRSDKTMVDALLPALEALRAAADEGAGLGDALRRSADAAAEGMRATIPLEARKGRASYLGPRSVGHQDPGATPRTCCSSAAQRRRST